MLLEKLSTEKIEAIQAAKIKELDHMFSRVSHFHPQLWSSKVESLRSYIARLDTECARRKGKI